jgi:hypothetical protein
MMCRPASPCGMSRRYRRHLTCTSAGECRIVLCSAGPDGEARVWSAESADISDGDRQHQVARASRSMIPPRPRPSRQTVAGRPDSVRRSANVKESVCGGASDRHRSTPLSIPLHSPHRWRDVVESRRFVSPLSLAGTDGLRTNRPSREEPARGLRVPARRRPPGIPIRSVGGWTRF